jgi:hypothetical protein
VKTVIFRHPTQKDQDELARNMRRSDVEEVAVMSKLTPQDVVFFSTAISKVCYAMRIQHGPLLCIFGAALPENMPGEASIWELGTDAIDRHPALFMRHCRAALRLVIDAMPDIDTFFNFIPESNQRSTRWLQKIGARFNATTITHNGIHIRGFVIDREVHHV